MIIYDPEQKVSFFEFGIQIPIMDSRARRTFESLKAHPSIGPRLAEWFTPKIQQVLDRTDLERVHDPAYIDRLYSDKLEDEIIKTYELVNSQGRYYRYHPASASQPLTKLFDRIQDRVYGTWQCCNVALEKNFCFYFGGGMHHAQKSFGNGFCLVNDIVIAIRKLQAQHRIQTAWIIDTDAHKGDGTAALTADDSSIVTLSIHMGRGWPLDGPSHDLGYRLNPSFIPSDIDIPVYAGEEPLYVSKLEDGLEKLGARPIPQLAVVVFGADPYEKDELPSTADLKLSLKQLFVRDRLVYEFLKVRQIPMAYLMAGGYGENSWRVYTQFLQWVLADRLGIWASAGGSV
jgi:acetoin utilization deacetylase AcuC-like enzyme